VQFTSNDRNYTNAAATFRIEVVPGTKRTDGEEAVPLKTKSQEKEKEKDKGKNTNH